MTDREKIIEILKQTSDLWKEEESHGYIVSVDLEKIADTLIEAGIGDVRVAERALLLMARGECTFASPEFYKEEAEQEVAKEEQIMANRCGEGKCEYFENIRRAANNNREDGYCKKYKQALHLYGWWWLKCDECTAEKKIAEDDKR